MKTVSMILVLLLASVASCPSGFAEGLVFNGWASIQFLGQHQATIGTASATNAVNTGIATGFDIGYQFFDSAELGIGAQNQFFRSQTLYQGGFGFDDIFVSLRLLYKTASITFYPVGRIGYGLYYGDTSYRGTYGTLTGGLYYAAGFGLRSPEFEYTFFGSKNRAHAFIEGTYESNSGSIHDSYFGFTANVVYTSWNIYIGIGSIAGGTAVKESEK